jgi:hypothetical protein
MRALFRLLAAALVFAAGVQPLNAGRPYPSAMMVRQSGTPVFSPNSLFASGEQGLWLDPSDFSTMFQDSAGTTPVTATGQSVGKILDKSGRGNHATQSSGSLKPILQQDGSGYYYLKFDGTDDYLVTPSINFSSDKVSVFAGIRKVADTAGVVQIFIELSASRSTNSGAFTCGAPSGASPNGDAYFASRGSVDGSSSVASANSLTAPITFVYSGLGDISGDSSILRSNGLQIASSAADQGTGNYGNYPVYVGMRGGATFPFSGRIYSVIIRAAATSGVDLTNTETWVNSKTGAY